MKKYLIGDPCYNNIFNDYNKWMSCLLETNFFENDLSSYKFEDNDVDAVSTLYGDGVYRGSDGFDYPVDAGLIGIFEYKGQDYRKDLLNLHEFRERPVVDVDANGVIVVTDGVKTVRIETGD
jgi:hypothetical protein